MINTALISQFSRFIAVGLVNTAIDFAVLNLLSWTTGIYSGSGIILLNSVAFTAAVVNSYFMNKYWTFGVRDGVKTSEVSKFLGVSLVGLGINTSLVYGITTLIVLPLPQVGPALWENFAKAVATGASLIWNFIGYKLFVFKK